MQKQLLLIALFLVSTFSFSQELKGKITEATTANQPLPGASVQWLNTQIGTTTDENGEFSIPYNSENTQLITKVIRRKVSQGNRPNRIMKQPPGIKESAKRRGEVREP